MKSRKALCLLSFAFILDIAIGISECHSNPAFEEPRTVNPGEFAGKLVKTVFWDLGIWEQKAHYEQPAGGASHNVYNDLKYQKQGDFSYWYKVDVTLPRTAHDTINLYILNGRRKYHIDTAPIRDFAFTTQDIRFVNDRLVLENEKLHSAIYSSRLERLDWKRQGTVAPTRREYVAHIELVNFYVRINGPDDIDFDIFYQPAGLQEMRNRIYKIGNTHELREIYFTASQPEYLRDRLIFLQRTKPHRKSKVDLSKLEWTPNGTGEKSYSAVLTYSTNRRIWR